MKAKKPARTSGKAKAQAKARASKYAMRLYVTGATPRSSRAITNLFTPGGVYLIDQWRQIGVTVELQDLTEPAYNEAQSTGAFSNQRPEPQPMVQLPQRPADASRQLQVIHLQGGLQGGSQVFALS